MANENEANFAKIGVFILAGITLIAGTLVYLGGMRDAKREYLVETYFPNDVSGLAVGSAVNFRGVRVGAVKEIAFIGAMYKNVEPLHARNVYVLMALDSRLCRMMANDTPEKFVKRLREQGIHATVTASGITGLSRIEMNFPKTEVPENKISWEPRYQLIPPAPSILESATESAAKILRQLNRMDFASVWSNVVQLTDNAAEMCGNANGILESQRGHISQILDNLDGAVSSLRTFAEAISDNPSLLLRPRDAQPLSETR